MLYTYSVHMSHGMIKSWKHKGLKRFFETGNTSGIITSHGPKLRQQLAFLDAAIRPEDLNLPGYSFHGLSGKLKNYYSISVSGSWRLIFKFEKEHAVLINYLNYH